MRRVFCCECAVAIIVQFCRIARIFIFAVRQDTGCRYGDHGKPCEKLVKHLFQRYRDKDSKIFKWSMGDGIYARAACISRASTDEHNKETQGMGRDCCKNEC